MENTTKQIAALKRIEQISPELDGEKWAIYGTACLWWTSFPEDCDRSGILPRCPFCGGALDRQPLGQFIAAAKHAIEHDPNRYGPTGLGALLAAHHRQAKTCRSRWDRYNVKIKEAKS